MEPAKWKFGMKPADYRNAVRIYIGKYTDGEPVWRNTVQISDDDSPRVIAKKLIGLGVSILENCE